MSTRKNNIFDEMCFLVWQFGIHFSYVIIQQMISQDDRLKMEVLHQTPKYCFSAFLKTRNQLLLLLRVYSPEKTFEQVVSLQKMPDTMKNTFESVQKIHDLLKDPMSTQVVYEEGKIKIRVPVSKQKTKSPYKIVTLRLIQTGQDLYKVARVISRLKHKIEGVRKNPNSSLEGKTTDQMKFPNHQPLMNEVSSNGINDSKSWDIKQIEKMMDEKIIGLKKELTEAVRIQTKRIEHEVKKEMKILVEQIYEENEREWERMVSFLINNLAAMTDNSLRNQFFTRQHSTKTIQEDSMPPNQAINSQQNLQPGKYKSNWEKNKAKKQTQSEHGEKKHLKAKNKQIPHIPLKEKQSEIANFMKRQKTDEIALDLVDSSKQQNQFSAQYSANYLCQSEVQVDPSESMQNSNEERNPQVQNLCEQKHDQSSLDEDQELEYEEEYIDESEDQPSGSDEEDILQSLRGKKIVIKGISGKSIRNRGKQNQSSSREAGEHMARNKEDSVKKCWKNSEKSLSKYPSNEDT